MIITKIIKAIWHGLGKPGAWIWLTLVVFANELLNGFTANGSFWLATCCICFYLSSINARQTAARRCQPQSGAGVLRLPTQEQPMTTRPDLFTHTVNTLLNGSTALELSEKLTECVEAARRTGKKATLSLTLNIKPIGRDTGQYEIRDDIKAKIPQLDKGMTLMFGTPEGNLQRDDPRQKKLDLKVADEPKPETFKTAGNK